METVSDLIDFVLQRDRCVVFGDLGRHPHVLFDALAAVPAIQVNVRSPFYRFDSSVPRIRVLKKGDDRVEKCDLLVYVEPASGSRVERHRLASRAVVFASHYSFETAEKWTDVCFFLNRNPEGVRRLKEREDFPIRTENVDLVRANYANAVVLSGRSAAVEEGAYAIVDLTAFRGETLPALLAFLDAFDVLLRSDARFVVCFSERGHAAFKRFVQRIVDALLCRRFRYGNVLDVRALFGLLPYYRGHTIERNDRLRPSSFGGLPFVAPKTEEEACAVALAHDVRPIVANVFWVLSGGEEKQR